MNVLVTGGCGFIGSEVVRNFLQRNWRVINLDALTYASTLESTSSCKKNPNYTFVQGNICDRNLLEKIFLEHKPDAVVHLAAESHVDRSIDGPAIFLQTNIIGTFELLQASLKHFRSLNDERKNQFRFLHISTDEVFGSLGENGYFHETYPVNPNSPYSASKASSDHLVRAWHHTYNLPTITTNCTNNYGPWQFPEKLIPLVAIRALHEQEIPVYGKGENVRDWLHVSDHVNALELALTKGVPGETYMIGGNSERSNLDVVKTICKILDTLHPRKNGPYEQLIKFVADRPGHDFRYAADCSKIEKELGWKSKYNFENGIRQTLEWYLENRNWWEKILEHKYKTERLGKT